MASVDVQWNGIWKQAPVWSRNPQKPRYLKDDSPVGYANLYL